MKRILKFGALVFSIIFLASCGSDNDTNPEYPYTYTYAEEGICSTPTVTSNSASELCKNLLDNQLNHSCAPAQRSATFELHQCGKVLGIADS